MKLMWAEKEDVAENQIFGNELLINAADKSEGCFSKNCEIMHMKCEGNCSFRKLLNGID